MSLEYDIYLKKHIDCVRHGYSWIINNLDLDAINRILPDIRSDIMSAQIAVHDSTKLFDEEYEAYDNYFYKGGKDTFEGKRAFDRAWHHHIHHNPHHWQYWILINDEGTFEGPNGNKIMALDIPDHYIMEMICDWWSFSWMKNLEKQKNLEGYDIDPLFGLEEIFEWYDDHKAKMLLSEKTREKVEQLLDLIHAKLDEMRLY